MRLRLLIVALAAPLLGCGEGATFDPHEPFPVPDGRVETSGPVSAAAEIAADSGDMIVTLWLTSLADEPVVVSWSACALQPRGYSAEGPTRRAWVHRQDPRRAGASGTCPTGTRVDTVPPGGAARLSRYLDPSLGDFGWPDDDHRLTVAVQLNGEVTEVPVARNDP